MKRKIIIIFLIATLFAVLLVLGINYLNKVVLPTKIKALIVETLQQRTGKTVSLDSVQFNLFRGLVLKNFEISDATKKLVSLKQATCNFFLPALLKREVVITHLKIYEGEFFLERKPGNSLNLLELLPQKNEAKGQFSFFVSRVTIANSRINFQDDTTTPVFKKTFENLNLSLALGLPAVAKFILNAEIPGKVISKIIAQGEFRIIQQQFHGKMELTNISITDFQAYYQQSGITVKDGNLDVKFVVDYKDNLVNIEAEMLSRDLALEKDQISAKFGSTLKSTLQYNLKEKKLKFSGYANILGMDLIGIEFINSLNDIRGLVKFSEAGITAENLTANCLGVPLEGNLNLINYADPLLDISLRSSPDINLVKSFLKDKWQIVIPADIQAKTNLLIKLNLKPLSSQQPEINGTLSIADATIKPQNLADPLKNVNGSIEFSQNQLKWSDFAFDYLTVPYKTSGLLTNFQAPGINFQLSSRQLCLESVLAVNQKLVKLAKLDGQFNNSQFSLTGDFDISDTAKIKSSLKGEFHLDLADSKQIFKKYSEKIEQLHPAGIIHGQVDLQGNINDLKRCEVMANLTSSTFSLFGLKSESLFLNYEQSDGVANIPVLRLGLYGGTLEGSAKVNLDTQDLPFWANFNLTDMRIEKLKADTPARDQDISGALRGQARINGFFTNWDKLIGTGQISVSNGKLWQLNLFKGMGSLLFTNDYTNVVFSEANCNFNIQDKTIYTDNLTMKSNLANLSGTLKIGFDGALDASLDVQVSEEAPLTGTFKDVTTAILGQAQRFGVIQINGTLKEPKYKFKTSVLNIFEGIKNTFLKKQQ